MVLVLGKVGQGAGLEILVEGSLEEQPLPPEQRRVSHLNLSGDPHLGALDGHWGVLGGRPQGAGVRDRGGFGKTEARTFSHEWSAGCEGTEEKQGEGLGEVARGLQQA